MGSISRKKLAKRTLAKKIARMSSPAKKISRYEVRVVSVSVLKIRIKGMEENIQRIYGIDALPLSKSRVFVEFKGAPTPFANALRRVMNDEMKGKCLMVKSPDAKKSQTEGKDSPADGKGGGRGYYSSDPFAMQPFVVGRIRLIPLRAQIPPSVIKTVRFELNAENDTASIKTIFSGDIQVAAGSLQIPIFNPTFQIAELRPKEVLRIPDIRIVEGYAYQEEPIPGSAARFKVACLTSLEHLDLKQYPESETHDRGGSQVDNSGYVESSLTSDPQHHKVTATVPATGEDLAETVTIPVDACSNILERLRRALRIATTAESSITGDNSDFTVSELIGGVNQGVLRIGGETHTIGKMLTRAVFDLMPDVSYVGDTRVEHENIMVLTVRHTEDIRKLVTGAIQICIDAMDALKTGIASAKIEAL